MFFLRDHCSELLKTGFGKHETGKTAGILPPKMREKSRKPAATVPEANAKKHEVFQQESTFVKMILGDLAKHSASGHKKLSDFRLELYNLYANGSVEKRPTVENPVESVEFHRKNGH